MTQYAGVIFDKNRQMYYNTGTEVACASFVVYKGLFISHTGRDLSNRGNREVDSPLWLTEAGINGMYKVWRGETGIGILQGTSL